MCLIGGWPSSARWHQVICVKTVFMRTVWRFLLLARQVPNWWPCIRKGGKSKLKKLRAVDWSRANEDLWEGRAMVHGRISKARTNVRLTASYLKQHMGLPLNADDEGA